MHVSPAHAGRGNASPAVARIVQGQARAQSLQRAGMSAEARRVFPVPLRDRFLDHRARSGGFVLPPVPPAPLQNAR
jgi:hypothetical protein